jgi:branched-subunit amino acid transport protein
MMLWLPVLAVTAANWAMKAGGPLALGDRRLPPRAVNVISLMASALLAGLIVTNLGGAGATSTGSRCSVSAQQGWRARSGHPCCSPLAAEWP